MLPDGCQKGFHLKILNEEHLTSKRISFIIWNTEKPPPWNARLGLRGSWMRPRRSGDGLCRQLKDDPQVSADV